MEQGGRDEALSSPQTPFLHPDQRGTVRRSPCKWLLRLDAHEAATMQKGPSSSLRGICHMGLEPHACCLATQEDIPPPVPRIPAFAGNPWARGTEELKKKGP